MATIEANIGRTLNVFGFLIWSFYEIEALRFFPLALLVGEQCRGKIVERSWLQLAVAAALHAQEITSRQMMSELVASRREALSSAQERQQLAESVRAEVDDQKQALETQTQRSQDEDMATCLKETC